MEGERERDREGRDSSMLLQGQWRNEVNKHNLIECPFLIHRDTPARSAAVVHERPRNAAALDSVARGQLLVRVHLRAFVRERSREGYERCDFFTLFIYFDRIINTHMTEFS